MHMAVSFIFTLQWQKINFVFYFPTHNSFHQSFEESKKTGPIEAFKPAYF
jgi:hypothetical protein